MTGSRACRPASLIATIGATLVLVSVGSPPGLEVPGAAAAFPGGNGLLAVVVAGQVKGLDPASGALTDIMTGLEAAWAPDGTRLAVTVMTGFGLDIVVAGADGAGRVNLTEDVEGQVFQPAWSPGGDELVVVEGTNTAVLTIMRADGSDKRRIDLTADMWTVSGPAWSPAGDRIAFAASYQAGESFTPTDVFTIDPMGGGLTQLTFHTDPDAEQGSSYAPDWSPDGSQLVVERDAPGGREIRVLNADGSGDLPVVAAAAKCGPVWSPDGTRIAFHVDADPPVVRIIAADGSDAQDVLTGESPAWVKDWQPLP